jgi:protein ImuB
VNRERTIVLWCPDWPIIAARSASAVPATVPLALVEHGMVYAASEEARQRGVRRGLTVREAQFRCTELTVLPYDPVLDRRTFDPVLDGIEALTPGVAVVRPGTCAIRARGPVRYYGGETAAAAALLHYLHGAGLSQARAGIADGPFAAEQAARHGTVAGPHSPVTPPDREDTDATSPLGAQPERDPRIRILAPGGSAAFLAPLPVATVADPTLSTLLARLGLHTLGQFGALPAQDVHRRFGAAAARAHAKAAGSEHEEIVPRTPTPVFDQGREFEPALDRIDQLAFALRGTAELFVQTLREHTLVCTVVTIFVATEDGLLTERTWRHPRWFTAADLIDRVRWQLQGEGRANSGLAAPVVRVTISPDRVDAVANHEAGLWGTGPDERIHHALTRVQGLVGHDGVVTAVIGGGRMLADRQRWVPWGDAAAVAHDARASRPWAGSLGGLLPATVYHSIPAVTLIAADGAPVGIDDRGAFLASPSRFSPGETGRDLREVVSWGGPWPVLERWWDPENAVAVHRAQIVDESGDAWLLLLGDAGWRAEARYD